MKKCFLALALLAAGTAGAQEHRLFLDVHHLAPGSVTPKDVAAAHVKDLDVQDRYGVRFLQYWVNSQDGLVYCLSEARDTAAIHATHAAAHGLLPQEYFEVSGGTEAEAAKKGRYFLDIHRLGAGKVTAAAVADAHTKDLAVQKKHGVRFINYWVDEKRGSVFCLSQAPHADSVVRTHKEAHGLLPQQVLPVERGN